MDQSFSWFKSQNQCNTTTAALPNHTMMDSSTFLLFTPCPALWTEPSSAFPVALGSTAPQAGQGGLILAGLAKVGLHRQHGGLHQEYFLGLGCHVIPAVPISAPQAALGRDLPEVTFPTGIQNGTRHQCSANWNLLMPLPKQAQKNHPGKQERCPAEGGGMCWGTGTSWSERQWNLLLGDHRISCSRVDPEWSLSPGTEQKLSWRRLWGPPLGWPLFWGASETSRGPSQPELCYSSG